ncbi:hypothetical protein KY285_033367 [Solanum tuberosum]|nr:hypothetical protein KY285_033367 [Solanum tuberosum]
MATATTTAASTTAVMCNLVYSSLESCLGYVLGGGLSSVPSKCCSGIKFVLNATRTRADRQSLCKCIKSIASSSIAVPISRLAKLPGMCMANVPFKICPNDDCSKIK